MWSCSINSQTDWHIRTRARTHAYTHTSTLLIQGKSAQAAPRKQEERHMYPPLCLLSVLLPIPGLSLTRPHPKLTREHNWKKKDRILWKLSLIFMQVVCSHSIQHHVEAAALYELLKLVMLCGWCCCHSCFCWTASCWDWSEVDRRFTRGDTQFAGMIKPVISKKNLWSRVQQKPLSYTWTEDCKPASPRNHIGETLDSSCS